MNITLFYKSITKAGGAERLLLNQYLWLKKNKYSVKVICFNFKDNLSFDNEESIEQDDILIFKGSWIYSMLKLFFYLSNKKTEVIVASGVKEIFLATLFSSNQYHLLLHHPLFMTMNETDKFSFFLKNKFNSMCETNYGANVFYKQIKSFSYFDFFKINLKACISIPSIKFAKNLFVLSDYSKNEKKILFKKEAIVCRGALNKNALNSMKFEKKDKNKIVCVSRLEDDKRIDVLLKSFKNLLKVYPNKYLIICGTGSCEKKLKDLAKSLNIKNNVSFKGFISDSEMKSLNKSAYLFISLDWADYKITLFEALLYSQRILVSNETSSIKELEDLSHIIRVQPDVESALRGMIQIYNSESKADYLYLKKFLTNFTWDSYNQKLFKHVFQTKN